MASEVRSRGATTMPESPVNPYESPSAAEETRSPRPTPPSATGFWVWTALNALLLLGILATKPVFASRFEALEAELPSHTTFALGPVIPWIHGGLLVAIIAARRALKAERYKDLWEVILIVLLSAVVGYYLIAFSLPLFPIRQPLTWAS
ncbi:MAG TPA: hypothetical protein VMY37_40675 [Thermoguttaceae bacterium]|nr:hypothetical protein [Thermoguttaceae bacterium]